MPPPLKLSLVSKEDLALAVAKQVVPFATEIAAGMDRVAAQIRTILITKFMPAFEAFEKQLAPHIPRIIEGLSKLSTRLNNLPPCEAFEALLIANGQEPGEARFLANWLLHCGREFKHEHNSRLALRGILKALIVAKPGTRNASEAAQKLQ